MRWFYQAAVAAPFEPVCWSTSSIPYVYAPIGIEDNQHWDDAVMYNSPLRPAIDAEADEILMVLLSPSHKLEENEPCPLVQRSALPPRPRGFRRVCKGADAVADHKEVRCAVIAPEEWLYSHQIQLRNDS